MSKRLKRLVHSPTSIALAERCPRAWWLRYREGLKQPEFTWAQVVAWDSYVKGGRRGKRPPEPKGGQRSTALGKEVHARAEVYLTARPGSRAARSINWHDLPGLCLAELVPHLPEAGSLRRQDVERNVTLTIGEGDDRVSFRGVIDIATAARGLLESYDHKTSGDIASYALLPPAVADRILKRWLTRVPAKARALLKPPARSLRDDLQACFYTLARAERATHLQPGGLVRWNYTETKRIRRSLPVVAYIPTAHARKVVARAADKAREVAAFKTIDDAVPNTLACDDYGGCWYRLEGHCTVKRKMSAVLALAEAKQTETEAMKSDKPKRFADLARDTAEANEAEERAARKAAKAAKRAPAPEPEEDEDDSDEEDEEDEDEAPESEPKPVRRKSSKEKLLDRIERAAEEDEDDEDDDDDEDPECGSNPAARKPVKSARAAAKEAFDAAVSDDKPADPAAHVLAHFDRAPAGASPQLANFHFAFRKLANDLATVLTPSNAERVVPLRQLLRARDEAFHALHTEGVATAPAVSKRKGK